MTQIVPPTLTREQKRERLETARSLLNALDKGEMGLAEIKERLNIAGVMIPEPRITADDLYRVVRVAPGTARWDVRWVWGGMDTVVVPNVPRLKLARQIKRALFHARMAPPTLD